MYSQLALGGLAVLATARMYQYRKISIQLTELTHENRILQAHEDARTSAQIVYLIGLLQKHGIEPTEFDLIALNFHADPD